MAEKVDLRVIRTRQMIKDAFLDLMDTVGFSKITVENLAKKAFISRNTFYLHYADKFDLLNKIESDMLEGLEKNISKMPFESIKNNGFDDAKVISCLQMVFDYIKENNKFFELIMGEKGDQAFLHKLGETVKSIVANKIVDGQTRIPQKYIVAIIIGIQTNIIKEWLHGGMNETPDEIVAMIATVFKDVPKHLFHS